MLPTPSSSWTVCPVRGDQFAIVTETRGLSFLSPPPPPPDPPTLPEQVMEVLKTDPMTAREVAMVLDRKTPVVANAVFRLKQAGRIRRISKCRWMLLE